MVRVLTIFLLALMASVSLGADALSLVPEDAAVVVVARKQGEALGALKAFLDSSVPDGAALPKEAQNAGIPALAGLIDARKSVDRLVAEMSAGGFSADSPAALLALAWGDGKWGVISIRPADEAAWREANKSRIKDGRSGAGVLSGAKPSYFEFVSGHLVMSDDAAALDAYNAARERPLRQSRASALQLAMRSSPIAVSVSASTAQAVWQDAKRDFCDRTADSLASDMRFAVKGMSTIMIPPGVYSKFLWDFIGKAEDLALGVKPAAEGITLSGRLIVKSDETFAYILCDQTGDAPDVTRLFSKRPAAAISMSLRGDVFWEYLKSFLPPFTAGVPTGGQRSPETLELFGALAKSFRGNVSLEKAALVWYPRDDWRNPPPTFVAEVPNGPVAVDTISASIKALYGDKMLVGYCRTLGLFLDKPVVENAKSGGRPVALVKVPFTLSADEPVKAAKMRQLLGTALTWRITCLTSAARQFVVAGDFPTNEALDAFVAMIKPAPATAGAAQANTMLSISTDLPAYTAALFKAVLKEGGRRPGEAVIPSTKSVCSVDALAEHSSGGSIGRDAVQVQASIPSDQIKASFAALTNVSNSGYSPTPEPSASGDSHTKKKAGKGRRADGEEEEPTSESDSRPRSPWGRGK